MNHATAPHIPAEPKLEAKETKSKGEKLFNRFVYGGLAGVVTFVVTLLAAFEIKHGRWNPHYTRAVNRVEGWLKQVMPSLASRKAAEIAVETTALMQGGNLMVIPVLLAEHHKVPIVSGLNVMVGDKTPPEAVEQAPKQTAMSLIEGRALAWGAVFSTLLAASLILPRTYGTFKAEFAEKIYHATQWVKRSLPNPATMKTSKSYQYGDIAAVDGFATAAAATLLYVGGHFFARKQEERHLRKELRAEGGLSLDTNGEAMAVKPEPALADKAARPAPSVAGSRAHEGVVHAAGQHELTSV